MVLIVFKARPGAATSGVSDLLTEDQAGRSLRSSNRGLLNIPRIHSKSAHGAFHSFCSHSLELPPTRPQVGF